MSFLADQFGDYSRVHGNRTNLPIHVVAVPVFDLAILGTVASVAARSWVGAVAGVAVAAAAFAAEGRGHALETNAPVPFAGPVNALTRIFAEQFITFPRYVLSGGWGRAYRAAEGGLSDRGGP
jgi:2-hydroxy-palmitic acid dioxygenase Mpo1-like